MSGGYLPRTGKPDAIYWMKAVREGVTYRDKLTAKQNWATWRNWYRGNFGQDILPVNVFFKLLRTMVPRVYYRNPQVSIVPRKRQQGTADYWLMSQLLEQVDNALFDRMKLKFAMKRAVQDAFLFGTGVVKLGYGGEFSPTPDPLSSEEAPSDKKGRRVEYNSFVLPDTPWTLRVPTGRFIVPKNALDWPSCRWAAHLERRHIDDVKDDKRFENVSDIKPGVLISDGGDTLNKTADMVDLYEVRDKKTGDVFVFSPTNSQKVMFHETDDLQFDMRLPYFPIQFNTDDEFFWAVPDTAILAPHQKELNEIRQVIRRHRAISVLKYIIKQGAMTPDEIVKLSSSNEVGAVLSLDKDANMADLKELVAADIPAGLIKSDQMENQIVQEVLGLGVNQFGEYAPGSADRSATESQIVNQATQIRTDERRDAVADQLVDLTEHLNHVILKKWDGDQVVSILGQQGQQVWVQFAASDIKALEYDVKIDPDSSVPETRAVRRQKASAIFQMFGQDPLSDPVKLRQRVMSEVADPTWLDVLKSQEQLQQEQAPGLANGAGSSPQNPAPMAQVLQAMKGGRG